MSWSALLAEDERLAREAAELASEGERFLAGSSSISIAALTVRGLDLLEKRRAWLQTAERELTPNPGDSWPGLASARAAYERARATVFEAIADTLPPATGRLSFDRALAAPGPKVLRQKRFETRAAPDGRIVLVGVEEIERVIDRADSPSATPDRATPPGSSPTSPFYIATRSGPSEIVRDDEGRVAGVRPADSQNGA